MSLPMSKQGSASRHQRAQQKIARQLGQIGFALPGTITRRKTRCGKAGCRCQADPPQLHGPYYLWTRKVEGKTVSKMLSKEQARKYQGWFDNWRKLRELTSELQTVSLEAMESIEE